LIVRSIKTSVEVSEKKKMMRRGRIIPVSIQILKITVERRKRKVKLIKLTNRNLFARNIPPKSL
jgi:hypothetical protein